MKMWNMMLCDVVIPTKEQCYIKAIVQYFLGCCLHQSYSLGQHGGLYTPLQVTQEPGNLLNPDQKIDVYGD